MSRLDTRQRIVDATIRGLGAHGIARLSVEDVARDAGLSRMTLYRYFATKDELLEAAILAEEERFIERVASAAASHRDVRPAIEAALAEALRAAREHPLLDRLLATEPEALLPFLTTGSGPLLNAARPVIEALVADRLPHLTDTQVRRAADAMNRLVASYIVNPPDDPLEQVAAELADLFVHGLKT